MNRKGYTLIDLLNGLEKSSKECGNLRFLNEIVTYNSTEVSERMRRWESVCGDLEFLENRLKWDGVTRDEAVGLFLAADCNPSWETFLRRMMNRLGKLDEEKSCFGAVGSSFEGELSAIPFSHLLRPWVTVAGELLMEKVQENSSLSQPQVFDLVSPKAFRSLVEELMNSLSRIGAASFYQLFEGVRTPGFNFFLRLHASQGKAYAGIEEEHVSQELYLKFCKDCVRLKYRPVFDRFPVLGRLMSLRTIYWLEVVSELLARLFADSAHIRDFLIQGCGILEPLRKVNLIEFGLSDPHDGGRTVARLTGESGQVFYYKPRDLSIERELGSFLNWFNQQQSFVFLPYAEVLCRGDYGWVQNVEFDVSEHFDERKYFEATGAFLFVAYLLNAADLHHGNVVATASGPVVIDGETFLQPDRMETVGGMVCQNLNLGQTGMLPCWGALGNGPETARISGLSPPPEKKSGPRGAIRWIKVNCDGMHPLQVSLEPQGRKNLPVVDGQVVRPNDYSTSIVLGFEWAYTFFLDNHHRLVGEDGALRGFAGAKIRLLFRETQAYGTLIQRALQPQNVRDGWNYSLAVENLTRLYLHDPSRESFVSVLRQEVASVSDLDVPRFWSHVRGRNLYSGKSRVGDVGLLPVSGLDTLEAKVSGLNLEFDLPLQSQILQDSLRPRSRYLDGCQLADCLDDTKSVCETAALALGGLILDRGLKSSDGSITWTGLFSSDSRNDGLQVIGDSLYCGRLGICVFLSALGKMDPSGPWRNACQQLLPCLLEKSLMGLRCSDNGRLVDGSLGACLGIGGALYGLSLIEENLGLPEIGCSLIEIMQTIPFSAIESDNCLDVMSGSAGLVISLVGSGLGLHGHGLDLVCQAGERLMAGIISDGEGLASWRVPFEPKSLTGFSHGAAGIGLALVIAGTVTKRSEFVEAGVRGFDWENSLLRGDSTNWPDRRSCSIGNPSLSAGNCMWCNGASGIGISRVAATALGVARNSYFDDIERAVEICLTSELLDIDNCCCGGFGVFELLLLSERVMGSLGGRLQSVRERVLRSAFDRGYFRVVSDDGGRGVFDPGFWTGYSGIGYGLLRLADPENWRSVLSFEPRNGWKFD